MGIDLPKLDDIGYRELRDAAQARIPGSAPAWSDHNLSDPGITLLELFSWLGDVELYRLNRVTPGHDRKFLALLGDRYPSAEAARGNAVSRDGIDDKVRINAGSRITIDSGSRKTVFRTRRTFYGTPAAISSVTVLGERNEDTLRHFTAGEGIKPFYAFGTAPKPRNFFRLNLDAFPFKRLKLHITLEEGDLPPCPPGWDRDMPWLRRHDGITLSWRLIVTTEQARQQVYTIHPLRDSTFHLRHSGFIEFILTQPIPSDDPIAAASVECRLKRGTYMIAPYIKEISLNTIELEQAEYLSVPAEGSGEALQHFAIERRFLLDPDGKGLHVESREPDGQSVPWRRVDTLHHSLGGDRHFLYDNITQQLVFGDGKRGALLPRETELRCRFTVTDGAEGNLPPLLAPLRMCETSDGTLLLSGDPACRSKEERDVTPAHFRIPEGSTGGRDLPDFRERFAAITAAWETPSQGVTLEDYESLAMATPGLRVARAKATADPAENRVTVTVVPYSRSSYAMPDDFFCARICRFLDRRRLITTRIAVRKPRYIRVALDVRIKGRVPFDEETLRARIIDTVDTYLHPLHGGDDGTGWPFGRPLYLSDIYALLEPLEGVDCVFSLGFSGEGRYDGRKKAYLIPPDTLIRATSHRVTFEHSTTHCGGLS